MIYTILLIKDIHFQEGDNLAESKPKSKPNGGDRTSIMATPATKSRFDAYVGHLSGVLSKNQTQEQALNILLELGEKNLIQLLDARSGLFSLDQDAHAAHNEVRKRLYASMLNQLGGD
jgi:hypothetical protein